MATGKDRVVTKAQTRIERLEVVIRPAGCFGQGRTCRQVIVVGDDTLDPAVPPVPTACPRCGRPVSALIVALAGVDADLL